MLPSRTDVPSLGVTRNVTSPLPCPDVGDNDEIQLADVEASHAHSGCAVTRKLPVPPSASIIIAVEPNDT
jgi:hypothetical protein